VRNSCLFVFDSAAKNGFNPRTVAGDVAETSWAKTQFNVTSSVTQTASARHKRQAVRINRAAFTNAAASVAVPMVMRK
jgi:ribulose 1,5-bisphosphate carboxylase large subunit-like protein